MNKKRVTIVEVPQMANGGWASQKGLGLYLPYPLSYDAKPYQQKDPEYRMKNTLQEVPEEDASAEMEKGEQVVGDFDSDGSPESMSVGGKRHSEGGTNVSVPDGSFVYSDTKKLRIKNPNILSMFDATKPQTPGKLAKKYPLNDWKSQMENPDTDPLARKTAEMMYTNNLRKLEQLKMVQELKKQSMGIPSSPQIMANGGKTGSNYTDYDYMYQHGYPQSQGYNDQYGHNTAGYQKYANEQGANLTVDDKFGVNTLNWQNPSAPTPANMQQNTQMDNLGTVPLKQMPTTITPYAPQMTNVSGTQTTSPTTGVTPIGTTGNKRKVRIEGLSANAIEDMALGMKALNTKKYSPWEPAVQVVKPQLLLESDQPIRNVLAENTNALTNAMYSGDTKAGRAAANNAQGELLRRSIQAAGEVSNRNQVTGNRYSELIANLDNQRLQAERERGTRLYDKSVIADQQYRNSLNALGQQYADTGRQREEKESFRQWQNKTSPYFMTDMKGRPEFKSEEAKATFLRQLDAQHGNSTNSRTIQAVKDQYIAAGGREEDAADFADDWYRKKSGLNNRTTRTTKSGNTTTKETKSKYGGLLASRKC